jgi:hypothetical protein
MHPDAVHERFILNILDGLEVEGNAMLDIRHEFVYAYSRNHWVVDVNARFFEVETFVFALIFTLVAVMSQQIGHLLAFWFSDWVLLSRQC